MEKTINSPGLLKEFLGTTPRIKDIIQLLTISALATIAIYWSNISYFEEISGWKTFWFIVITFDIFAGAVGNFTKSTQRHYIKNRKRIEFLLLHFLHLGGLYYVVGNFTFFISMYIFVVSSAMLVNSVESLKQKEIHAASLFIIGIMFFYMAFEIPQVIFWLPAIIMLKLLIGFSVKREH